VNQSPEQWLGMAKAVSDAWGLTTFIYVALIIAIAFGVYKKFFDKD